MKKLALKFSVDKTPILKHTTVAMTKRNINRLIKRIDNALLSSKLKK